ncbi:penicillin-binding protein 1C [Leptospira gomenensis]|uniref:peptidoglycan glycosyltransferase n=1 Tax=Leptospira gomenensis TaxID=2484974 RepID=A0A5F1YBX7_9LEPT|nr:penicillin-binding protein 1C [Leptospira gomenensis]TGK35114.1 penicillin-binding protein 1C [Leptospira gomenensis]TGK35209.1 penicillin-binding protein 1C [Leptospira gomenensis]TGK41070.1 penicillin-binding protein 1C [Leptospira gomenensis]TGK61300.1 penicillin-binding protein 1C [Leptospira gomenensis]
MSQPLKEIPSFESIRNSYLPSDATFTDRYGRILQTVRLEKKERKLSWTEEGEIPETLLVVLLLQEDKRFFEHSGVDWLAILGAVRDRVLGNSKRGASTLSMQLAGIFLQTKPGRRNIFDKWEQMTLAKELERRWKKNEIIIAYLNLVQFRGEYKGIRAASRGLFSKEPSALTDIESILLVSMLPFPEANLDSLNKRACNLSEKIGERVFCDSIVIASKEIRKKRKSLFAEDGIAYHAARRSLRSGEAAPDRNGIRRTTLDFDLQWKIVLSAKNVLEGLKRQNVAEAGVLVLENSSGAVLAYVGNLENSKSFYVDAVQSRRQAGSTLKPFLYALAFEKNLLKPDSLLDDSPYEWNAVSGIYRPSNYGDVYHGKVAAGVALASSLNIPAIHVLELVGVSEFVKMLNELGIDGLKRPDYYGSSLALGTADVTLEELTNAYRTLANGGSYSPITLDPFVAKQMFDDFGSDSPYFWKRTYSASTAEKLSSILSDREFRSLSFGLNNHLSTRFFTAVKTGTSQDMRDNWCVGYSKRYTVGVWVGNMDGSPMWDVSGVTGAAPIWNSVMNLLSERESETSSSIQTAEFKTTSSKPKTADLSLIPKILSPGNDTVFALDPDIPGERQRIRFLSSAFEPGFDWILNGKKLDLSNTKEVYWKPEKGFHILSLRDREGKMIDSVVFEVR